jgi:hypothetical protein
MLPQLNTYIDLISKLDYDLERYSKTNHIYELLDCLMTLNAIPEWIIGDAEAPDRLKLVAREKINIMKDFNFTLDENKLDSEIDHKLRFIRLICNHSKHKTNAPSIPVIKSVYGATFPMILPAKLCNIIVIGNKEIDAESLLKEVVFFWKSEMEL